MNIQSSFWLDILSLSGIGFYFMNKKIKREREQDWKKAVNFIPKKDEIIVYDCEDREIRFKIGDGKTKVNDLPFTDDNSFVVLDGNFTVGD